MNNKDSKPNKIIKNKEKEKKHKNIEPCVNQCHHFIPIAVCVKEYLL